MRLAGSDRKASGLGWMLGVAVLLVAGAPVHAQERYVPLSPDEAPIHHHAVSKAKRERDLTIGRQSRRERAFLANRDTVDPTVDQYGSHTGHYRGDSFHHEAPIAVVGDVGAAFGVDRVYDPVGGQVFGQYSTAYPDTTYYGGYGYGYGVPEVRHAIDGDRVLLDTHTGLPQVHGYTAYPSSARIVTAGSARVCETPRRHCDLVSEAPLGSPCSCLGADGLRWRGRVVD